MGNIITSNTSGYFPFVSSQLCLNFGIQVGMWAVSSVFCTEKLYDITGSCTYLVLVVHALMDKYYRSGGVSNLDILLSSVVGVWAVRLGSFLFARALKFGDSRFQKVIHKPWMFLVYWLVQGLWICITSLPAISTINLYSKDDDTITGSLLGTGGLTLWTVGFLLEVIADYQKYNFKLEPANRTKFIKEGLWAFLQYPNYYGEMILWWGVYILCCSKFRGWRYLFALSPAYVMYQLIFISGIRIQKIQALRRWKNDPSFEKYLKQLWF